MNEGLSFAQRALKRRKCIDMEAENKCMDSRFLLPLSKICEIMLSKVGTIFWQRRKSWTH